MTMTYVQRRPIIDEVIKIPPQVKATPHFPLILDRSVIRYQPETPSILLLAHILVGEPDSTLGSSPRACFAGTCGSVSKFAKPS
jgi:hypothetical protein